jgi:hypothetical protein
MGAAAFLETRSVAVDPGMEAVASIRVRNTGTVVDQFTLSILGDPQAWSTIEPLTLSLFPGAEETARITFRPPRSADVPAGEMPFGIRIDSKEDPAGDVVEEGVLNIGVFTDTYAELAPRTSRGSRKATHDLAVDNRGNIRLNAQITANDPDKALDFDLQPPSVVADPGTAAISKVAVKPRKRFWRGPPKTHPFRVEVLSPGAAAVGVDGTMLQEAMLPANALRALIAALAILVIAVLAYFFLLKPSIESIARQELIAAGATVDPSGQPVLPGSQRKPAGGGGGAPTPTPAGGGGGGGGGGSPSPTTGGGGGGSPSPTASGGTGTSGSPTDTGSAGAPTPAPTAPNLAPAQRDGRLLAGSEEVVPAGVTLYVTDLIFSNPSDTFTGRMILGRRDHNTDPFTEQILLELQLQNFRDLDFHWVTPLTFGSNFAMYVSCPDPDGCAGAAVSWSGYQR